LVYDVTSTYFEGQANKNTKAAHGYSRNKRPDCKQVCIGMVVTPEGLPLSYEVFAGNCFAPPHPGATLRGSLRLAV
jgi:transposase